MNQLKPFLKNSKLSLRSLRLFKLLACDPERALVDGASDAGHGVGSVLAGGALVHPLGADLQLRFAEVVDHPFGVDAKQGGYLDRVVLVPALN